MKTYKFPPTKQELDAIAHDLIDVRQMIDELEAEKAALEDQIKAAMVEQGAETLLGDGWKASWKNITASRFDSKAFRADHAALYTQYSKETVSTRFTLTV